MIIHEDLLYKIISTNANKKDKNNKKLIKYKNKRIISPSHILLRYLNKI